MVSASNTLSGTGKEVPVRPKLSTILALMLGLVLAAGLVWLQGPGEVWAMLVGSGWALLAISLYRFFPLAMDAWAWNSLFPAPFRRSFLPMFRARWIGESVNTLLPVAQIGGDVVRARLAGILPPARQPAHPHADEADEKAASRGDVPENKLAGASVVVDFLLGLLTQAMFTLVGTGLLAARLSGGEGADLLPALVLVSLAGLGGLAALLWLLQRGGLGRILAMARKLFGPEKASRMAGGAESLNAAVTTLLARRRVASSAALWKLAAWLLRSVEIWIILLLMDQPVSLAEAVIIESLASAVRSAAFVVPGAVGVQEGGILAIAALLGIPAETAIAVALLRRGRELVTSLPGLLAWSLAERGALGRLLAGKKAETAPE